MKKLLPLFFFIPFLAVAQQPYYSDVDLTLDGMELMQELSDKIIVTHTNELSYTPGIWNASIATDEDPDNSDNVLLLYGYDDNDGETLTDRSRAKNLNGGDPGQWNREHTYAKSLGTPPFDNDDVPGSDAHHLRPSDVAMNSLRGNRKFTDGSGHADVIGTHFYPGDEWKGDVARMMMYMYLRYGDRTLPSNVAVGTTNEIDPNMINLLLEWNAEDPVSQIEDNRNAYHDSDNTYAQGNRNPFIDNPFLATRIWGGPVAEDRWNTSDDEEAPTAPANLVANNVTENSVDLTWDASTDNEAVAGYSIYVDGDFYTSTANTSYTVQDLNSGTNYSFYVLATDAAGNTSAQSNVAEATTLDGPNYVFYEDFNDCSTVVNNFFIYSQTSPENWECADQFGQDNTGSYQMNAYNGSETVPSIDWLITAYPIDMDLYEDELLSFYTDASFGNTELELLYSTDYDEQGNAENYTWQPVPNVEIPVHSGASNEEVFIFENVDISSIQGEVYFAFRYDTDGGEATRWTVDNFMISTTSELSVNENNLLEFTVYPNPSNGAVQIIVPDANKINISLYDISGKRILSKEQTIIEGETSMGNLSAGFYLLKVSANGKTATKKLIVR